MVNYNNIVTAFEAFADKHLLLEGFSHGAPDSVDVEKVKRYPFLHLVYTGANYEVTGNAGNKTYAFEVYILGSPSTDNDESGIRVDVQTQAVSDIEQIAEDLLADIQQGHKVFDLGLHYGLNSARMTPLTDTRSNLLVGVLLDITIDLPYGFDACNPPLEGVTPAGSVLTSPVDSAALTVRESDGTPNVSGVTTIQVTDGTLTDNGSGVVTIDTGGGGASSLNELTDVDLTSTANNETLVFNSTSSKFENGFPISTGQVSIFKRNSPASAAFSYGVGLTTVEFGSFLAGGVTYENEIRAGAAFGLNTNHNLLQMLPVSVGSTISVEISYDITLDTSGVASVGTNNATGQLQNGIPAAQNDFSAGTVTRTITGTPTSIPFFSTSNTLGFTITSSVTGTFRPHYIKVTITHA